MKSISRIEQSLAAAIGMGEDASCPPKLAGAIRHAVFPGGARIRPQLCLAVARACGEDDPLLADATAVALELLHCASLVHDDLPCFDNADTRRGRASVQWAYGPALAVLAGDALIVRAFQTLAHGACDSPQRLPGLMLTIGAGVGTPAGIVAGQAWESESRVVLSDYQRAKTGALFVAATAGGAQAAGADPQPWRALGDWLGEAYQVADDIRDAAADPGLLGKPVGRDVALGRPSAAIELGLGGALAHFRELIARASASIPECAGAEALRQIVQAESLRLIPVAMADALLQRAAVSAAVAS
jgi:geranylgeranyl diphosphate synthase, type II